jgi:hypothetical protein
MSEQEMMVIFISLPPYLSYQYLLINFPSYYHVSEQKE